MQAISREMYGSRSKQMILELNASDDRGISVVRNQIRTFAETRPPLYKNGDQTNVSSSQHAINDENDARAKRLTTPTNPTVNLFTFFGEKSKTPVTSRVKEEQKIHPNLANLKLVILDEVDQMTAAAQTALRRIMEKYASHVRFFLMCNDIGKINPPIQSRCTKFRFPPLKNEQIRAKLQELITDEKLEISEDGVQTLLQTCHGDMRRLVNTIQACQLSNPNVIIESETILNILGLPSAEEINRIFGLLCSGTMQEAFSALVDSICQKGNSLADIIAAIYERVVCIDWINTSALTLFPRLSKIQTAVSSGGNEVVQAAALAAAFVEVRKDLESHGVSGIGALKPFQRDVSMK